MKHYGIDSQYILSAEGVTTLPAWDTKYKRSFVYANDENKMYYGTATGWAAWGTSGTSGSSGSSGVSGTSGSSGVSGSSGTSGVSGTSGSYQIIQCGSSLVTNVNSTTPVAVGFDIEDFKDSSYFTHSNSTNNSRVSVASAGIYRITYSVATTAGGFKTTRVRVRTDGTTYITRGSSYGLTRNLTDCYSNNVSSLLLQLSAGSYIELMADKVGSNQATTLIANASVLIMELIRLT